MAHAWILEIRLTIEKAERYMRMLIASATDISWDEAKKYSTKSGRIHGQTKITNAENI